MWEVHLIMLFKVILDSLKLSVKKNICWKISTDAKNDAKIWIALKKQYDVFKMNMRDIIYNKLVNINIKNHENDVIRYIIYFKKLIEKINLFNINLSQFFVINWFIVNLNNYQFTLIQIKKNKIKDVINKRKLIKLDLNILINQLTSHAQAEKNMIKKLKKNEKKNIKKNEFKKNKKTTILQT